MNYVFPLIESIEQVRKAIKDRPEFIEADRENYVVFNYMVAHEDSFDCPVRRECRGLIFSKDGKVLSRRLHKFFNLGEKEETLSEKINWDIPHIVLEKLDGSMITPLVFKEKGPPVPKGYTPQDKMVVKWATKMGITDIGGDVERYVENHPQYKTFAVNCHRAGKTPIFEYIAPTNRIVVPYEEERLILIAIRGNEMGLYSTLEYLQHMGRMYNIPVVQIYNGSLDDLKSKSGMEGVVVRFFNGHMIKVKTDWYVAIHKAKENILFEKNVVKLILEEKIDDVFADLPESDKEKVSKYRDELLGKIEACAATLEVNVHRLQNEGVTRKDFAQKYASSWSSVFVPVVFRCWDKPTFEHMYDELKKMILKYCSSQSKLGEIRELLPEKW